MTDSDYGDPPLVDDLPKLSYEIEQFMHNWINVRPPGWPPYVWTDLIRRVIPLREWALVTALRSVEAPHVGRLPIVVRSTGSVPTATLEFQTKDGVRIERFEAQENVSVWVCATCQGSGSDQCSENYLTDLDTGRRFTGSDRLEPLSVRVLPTPTAAVSPAATMGQGVGLVQ